MPGRIPGVEELLEKVRAKVYVHKAEREFLKGFGSDLVKVDNHDTLPVGRLTLEFLHTPGHTPGSQCFLVDGRLVSGDTLFIGSCGRTDLPGSDPSEMYYSLTQRLGALPDQTILLPGHNYGGASSTVGRRSARIRSCASRRSASSSARWAGAASSSLSAGDDNRPSASLARRSSLRRTRRTPPSRRSSPRFAI